MIKTSQIIILFAVISIFGFLLSYFEFYLMSFIIEVLGLITITVYLSTLLESSSNENIDQFLGLSKKMLYLLLFVTALLSLPFWFSECITLGSATFHRRAFATYSYSTLVKAPVFEEIIFRGIILTALLKRYSPRKAIGYNALLFTAIHLQFGFLFFDITLLIILFLVFIFGGILAYTQYKTNNLLIVIILHAIANILIIFFPPFDPLIVNESCGNL